MTTHQIAIGWDQIDNLADVAYAPYRIVDPRSPTNAPARSRTAGDGAVIQDGYTLTYWVYADYLTTTRMTYLLTQFGLLDGAVVLPSREVTVRTPGPLRDWEYWNAIILRPSMEYTFARFGEQVFELRLREYRPRAFTDEFTSEFE